MTDVQSFVTEEGIPVLMPSGAEFKVLTQDEADYLDDRIARYMDINKFANISDIADLDRMLIFELLTFRYGLWLARGRDYFDETVESQSLRKTLIDMSGELRMIKTKLQIDKVSRDRNRGTDSVAAYLENLRRRAKEFGIHRDRQSAKAIELMNDIIAFLTVHDNCLAGDTEVITLNGTRRIKDLVDFSPTLLTGALSGLWREAEVKSFGNRTLVDVHLKRNRSTKIVSCTDSHRWLVRGDNHQRSEVRTEDLVAGMKLVSTFGRLPGLVMPSPVGVCAGLVFGDGTVDWKIIGAGSKLTLCAAKQRYLPYFAAFPTAIVPEIGTKVSGLPRLWKLAPPMQESVSYLYGWLAGYFAADGSVSKIGSPSIVSHSRDDIFVARDVAYRLAFPTLGVTSHTPAGGSGYKSNRTAYRLNFPVGGLPLEFFLNPEHRSRAHAPSERHGSLMPDWKVISVKQTNRVEEVFCAVVPEEHTFTLSDNLLTGNSDEQEKRELHVTDADFFEYLRNRVVPEYQELDESFRLNQKMWVRDL